MKLNIFEKQWTTIFKRAANFIKDPFRTKWKLFKNWMFYINSYFSQQRLSSEMITEIYLGNRNYQDQEK